MNFSAKKICKVLLCIKLEAYSPDTYFILDSRKWFVYDRPQWFHTWLLRNGPCLFCFYMLNLMRKYSLFIISLLTKVADSWYPDCSLFRLFSFYPFFLRFVILPMCLWGRWNWQLTCLYWPWVSSLKDYFFTVFRL